VLSVSDTGIGIPAIESRSTVRTAVSRIH